ncbi:MAG: indole-3-glycerol phosphate synthase TrpC [Eubacterium sp.]|nr:indole-3-glycerol phosphate synthase TrpC [Eubacterium sp.]
MILDVIVEDKKKRLKEQKKKISPEEMKALALDCERTSISFYDALAKEGLSIIGEFKKASPSMGQIRQTMELTDRIGEYNGSADAISCLTEEDHFSGNVDYFRQIREITPLPMIRKDFIIDPYQIYEAKVIGADCILLIAAILTDEQLKEYYQLADSLGMDVLMEVHDEEEMQRALKIKPRIIGVNNRNLRDFTISLENTKRLRPMVPEGTVFVSESGVTEDRHIAFLKECGVDALLIGGAFMLSEHPKELAQHWKNIYDGGSGNEQTLD